MKKHSFLALSLCLILAAQGRAESVITQVRESQARAAAGDLDGALKLAEQAVKDDPAYAPGWRQLGVVYFKDRRFSKAVEALSSAMALDASHVGTAFDLARAHWYADQHDLATAQLEKALALAPDRHTGWRDLGRWRWASGDRKGAIEAMVKAVKLQRGDAISWRDLARWYWATGNRGAAVAAMETAATLLPDDAATQQEHARWLWTMGKRTEAITVQKRVAKMLPKDAGAWRDLGRWLWAEKQKEEALQVMRKAIKLAPDDATLWRDIGWAAWDKGLHDEAIAALKSAIQKDVPGRNRVLIQLLASVAEQGRAEQAVLLAGELAPDEPIGQIAYEVFASGRAMASMPFFEAAWERQRSPRVGLYLAYVGALNGSTAPVEDLITPFVENKLEDASDEDLNILLEILKTAQTSPALEKLIIQVEQRVKDDPEQSRKITDIVARAAETHRVAGRREVSLQLYRRVIERDPNHPRWFTAVHLSRELETPAQTRQLLRDIAGRTSDPGIQAGAAGALAVLADDNKKAIAEYKRSISLRADQPQVRLEIYRLSVAGGDLDEAEKQAQWFDDRISKGGAQYRSYLAEMWTGLGRIEKALEHWELLHLSAPHVPYYGVETARAYYQLCDAEQAIAVLEDVLLHAQRALVFEMLAEIYTALGRTDDALQISEQGLAMDASQNLRRLYCESAEAEDQLNEDTLAIAQDYLEQDPGYTPISLIAANCLLALGREDEAREAHVALLKRNSAFLPSLQYLRDDATRRREFNEAERYAERIVELRPDDPEARRRLAVTHAEGEHYRAALRSLRQLAKRNAGADTAVLLYRRVVPCDFPGSVRVGQIAEHLERLKKEEYGFALPADLDTPGEKPRVMLVFEDLSGNVTDAIDALLAEHKARAVYVTRTSVMSHRTPGRPGPAQLKAMRESGRWVIASQGPATLRRAMIDKSGARGNPMTHRLVTDSRETSSEFKQRITGLLKDSANGLGETPTLLYPFGDAGFTSLDTSDETLAILHDAVAERFDYAIFYDGDGFYDSSAGGRNVPAKRVPPTWDADALSGHLRKQRPSTRAKLELAKILQWHRQHEDAEVWFKEALAAGAEPIDLHINWAANALYAGDLTAAATRLDTAAELGAPAERIERLEGIIEQRRRPHLRASVTGWEDNEERDYTGYAVRGDAFVHERVQAEAFAGYETWDKAGLDKEDGSRYGLGVGVDLPNAAEFSASLWRLDIVDLPAGNRFADFLGWDAALRLPSSWINGHTRFAAGRREIETVEAIRADIYSEHYTVNLYSRVLDLWDLYARGTLNHRIHEVGDDNDTTEFAGRIVRRFKERPYLGVGYSVRIADSDEDPDEYWAPEDYEQHQLYVTVRGNVSDHVSGSVSAQTGYAREADSDWEAKWGAQGQLEAQIRAVSLGAGVNYFEGPIYERLTWNASLGITF